MAAATLAEESKGPSLEAIVCDSTIPNYLADCETYEGKYAPGTVDNIKEYLQLRGLTELTTEEGENEEE